MSEQGKKGRRMGWVWVIGIALLILPLIGIGFFAVKAQESRNGKALGLQDGTLADCPESPNCVCSESKCEGRPCFIEPLELAAITEADIEKVIEEAGGKVTKSNSGYIASEFQSSLFGFVDDLEVRIDQPKKLIHFRSASRVGHSDLGANRARVEKLKQMLMEGSKK